MTLVKCDKCGKMVSNNASKCIYCGKPLKHKTTEKSKNTIKCKNCGKRYNASYKSCPYCTNEQVEVKEEKAYYKYLDFLRVIFCIAILLYHIGFLKGGYLAVCSFFVLSSYLAVLSAFKSEKFDLGKYYKSRLLKLYLPVIIVVFMTIPLVNSIKGLIWLNLRPETTSVLFGYNNFWQIGANLDYFARHTSSPFMHLWYISILMQFELVFPFIFMLLRKMGDKINKELPSIGAFALALASSIYFFICLNGKNIMIPYYNTFARSFSLLFGLGCGFMHVYYSDRVPKKIKDQPIWSKVIFYLYLLITILLFIFIKSDSPFLGASMMIVTFTSCRLIEYGISFNKCHIPINDYVMKTLSGMTLWVYLFQYPLIYVFQYVQLNMGLKMTLMILILISISFILYYIFRKERKYKWLQELLVAIICALTIFGAWQFCTSKDNTYELKALEDQLAENEEKAKESQKEYEKKLAEAQKKLDSTLSDIDATLENLSTTILELPILGIGDSIMLGASPTLEEKFVNSHFDGAVSRQIWGSYDVIDEYKKSNTLGNPIVINLGANGNCGEEYKRKLVESFGDREIFWATVTNDSTVQINDSIKALAEEYPNLHVFDWAAISKGHAEYFAVDGIHLTGSGSQAYADGLYDAIYKVYEEKYTKLKDEAINNFETEEKNKFSFYGNDLLLNAFSLLKDTYKDDAFNMDSSLDYKKLKEKIQKDIDDKKINNKVVIALDNSVELSKENYEELINLLKDQKVYIILTTSDSVKIFKDYEKDNVITINFYDEMNKNKDKYLLKDETHLTEDGNKALIKLLDKSLKDSSN